MEGGEERGGLGWLAGWSGMMMVGETKRVDVEYTEVGAEHGHGGYRGRGREKERVQRTGANFRLARALSLGFYARSTRSAFRTEGKKERGASSLADRAVAKLKDLLKNPTDYWSQFGEDGSYLLAPDRGKGVKKRVMERGAGCS